MKKLFLPIAFTLLSSPSLLSQNPVTRSACVSASGSGTAYTCAYTVSPAAYAKGNVYNVLLDVISSSTTPTININSLGAKTIVLSGGGALSSSTYIPANAALTLFYDGTNMQIASIAGSSGGGSANPFVTKSYITPVAASCPSSQTALQSYTLPATIAAGDMVDVFWGMTRIGTAGTAQYGGLLFAGVDVADVGNAGAILTIPNNGFVPSNGATFRARIQVISSTAASMEISRTLPSGGINAVSSYYPSTLTIGSTPVVAFYGQGCSAGDTMQLTNAIITVYKAVP